jgi:glucose/arabinose dehydrogenase
MNATRISRSPRLVGAAPAFADDSVRTGVAAFGDWRTDAQGARRLITPADLPAPFATRSTANMSQREARSEAEIPKAPLGFSVDLFATGLNMPRVLRVAPNGDIFVAETGAGSVRVFRPGAGSGPAKGEIFAAGLQRPYGDRSLPVRTRSEVCLCRVAGLHRALSLSQRRSESRRPCGKDRDLAERWRSLDARSRVLA